MYRAEWDYTIETQGQAHFEGSQVLYTDVKRLKSPQAVDFFDSNDDILLRL